jgi:biotin carboxyl carrier protein
MNETGDKRPGPKAKLLLLGVTFLAILVPYLFWQGTWFGRPLTDKEMAEYLSPTAKPRKTQHALVQLSERMARGEEEAVRRWYPAILGLGSHSVPEVRVTVAWLMGQDNKSSDFHEALSAMVRDPNPLVRRNAALALVRFGDGTGRAEILTMLRPYRVLSPTPGALNFRLREDDSVSTGTLLARIQYSPQQANEVRSPLPGFFETKLVEEGKTVAAGEEIIQLSPAEEQVWEALRALYLVGEPEDLPDIERFTGRAAHMSDRIQQQARLTVAAVKQRNLPAERLTSN